MDELGANHPEQNPMASGVAFEASQAARLEGQCRSIRVAREHE